MGTINIKNKIIYEIITHIFNQMFFSPIFKSSFIRVLCRSQPTISSEVTLNSQSELSRIFRQTCSPSTCLTWLHTLFHLSSDLYIINVSPNIMLIYNHLNHISTIHSIINISASSKILNSLLTYQNFHVSKQIYKYLSTTNIISIT